MAADDFDDSSFGGNGHDRRGGRLELVRPGSESEISEQLSQPTGGAPREEDGGRGERVHQLRVLRRARRALRHRAVHAQVTQQRKYCRQQPDRLLPRNDLLREQAKRKILISGGWCKTW